MADSEDKADCSSTVQETSQETTQETDVLLNIPEEKRDDYIALDCEMAGSYRNKSVLIRATLIDGHGKVVLDEYCKPRAPIYAMRTWCHGILQEDLIGKQSDIELIKKIHGIIKFKIIIGHALKFDFQVLRFSHPQSKIRDTAVHYAWKLGKQTPSLRELAQKKVGIEIQTGTHDSKEDALAALKIFAKEYESWENGISPETLIRKRKLFEDKKGSIVASISQEQPAQPLTGETNAKEAKLSPEK